MHQWHTGYAIIVTLLWAVASVAPAANWSCGQDLNGDGELSSRGETGTCYESTSGGQLCPVAAVSCTSNQVMTCQPGTGTCSPVTEYRCPLGNNYSCTENSSGVRQCSPNTCVDLENQPPLTEDINTGIYKDDGFRSADGTCLGQTLIFSGRAMKCDKAGVSTAYQNCCKNTGKVFSDDTGGSTTGVLMNPVTMASAVLKYFTQSCDQTSTETAVLNGSGFCYELGEYCREEWEVVGCVQKAKSYCCFNSKMARLIHQQGRSQLNTISGFGSPKKPNCRGLTPEEFQSIDFSKIDFSEYYGDLVPDTQAQMTDKVNDGIKNFFNSTQ